MKPHQLPASIVQRLIKLVRAYERTSQYGPRPKRGQPAIWVLDDRARNLLAEIERIDGLDPVDSMKLSPEHEAEARRILRKGGPR